MLCKRLLSTRSFTSLKSRLVSGGAPCLSVRNILISASQAAEHVGKPNVKFIDVRAPAEYINAHVPGALNMRDFFTYLGKSSESGKQDMIDTFTELLQAKGINGTDKIITYEGNFQGTFGASCRAWFMLDLFGHMDTNVLYGGWDAWSAENLPTESGDEVESDQRGEFQIKWNNSKWVGLDDIKEMLALRSKGDQSCKTKLLDVRDMDEWNAYSSSPYGVNFTPRMGRLPDAKHVEWYNLMETRPNGVTLFKSPDVIRGIVEEQGIKPEDDIIVYCFKGARAANSLIALKTAGYENVRNYFASWNEWSREDQPEIDERKMESGADQQHPA